MQTITVSKRELNDLVKNTVQKAVRETLKEIIISKKSRKGFLELLEDWTFGQLIEEGRKYEYIDKKEFMSFLDKKIVGLL